MPERVDLRRMLRSPGSLLLAGALAVGTVACNSEAQASSGPKLKCPTTPAEVSYLVGGDPESWKPIERIKGSWRFKSEVPQILNGTTKGRVDTSGAGRIAILSGRSATEAWYVCVEGAGVTEPTAQNPQ